MPKLIIDTIAVEVPEGTNVLEAARSVGIVIPHFCWHPALGKAGACRVCAVKILEGTPKGVQMSCMLPAQDGMVVSTGDEEAVALRRSVIEWLMINHPHDCPVCDEGGECQLQDFTIAGGHSIRRYDGRKRTYINQYLGPYIEHEMNRCIQCYRCARFYQEYAGGTDFGTMGRAAMIYFGRQQDGQLESPFSGNLVDICPTGVFTDKTARFRARYWDYDMAPSVCPHCSLGCNTIPAARYRELLKVMARRNDAINGWFICDRGRFSNAAVNTPERPRQPLVDGQKVDWNKALDTLAERLQKFLEIHGPESLAIVGSPRMSMEGNIMAARLRDFLKAGTLSYFEDTELNRRTLEATGRLTRDTSASLADVRGADLVAIIGCDPSEQSPMMALAIRQAWRKGARVFRVESGRSEAGDTGISPLYESSHADSVASLPLAEAARPVLICGTNEAGLEALQITPPAKFAFLLNGPNAFGCAELAAEQGAASLAEALAAGTIKGVVAFETDLAGDLPDNIQVLATADWRATALVERAEVVLPTTAWVEMDGTFINNEGRAQRFKQVMHPGLPIKGLTPELHPPHGFRKTAPGSEPTPAWQWIELLMSRMGAQSLDAPLSGHWERLKQLDPEQGGLSVLHERN